MTRIVSRIYQGWNVVLAAMIVVALTGGVAAYSIPVFDAEMAKELGERLRGAMELKALVTFAVSGIVAMLVGVVVDRRGARFALFVGAAMLTTCCVVYSRAASTPSSLLAVHAGLGVGAAMSGPIAAAVVVGDWFEKRSVGLAMAVVLSGITLGSFALPPLVSWCTSYVGWRDASLYLAMVPLSTIALIALLIPSNASATEPSTTRERLSLVDPSLLLLLAATVVANHAFFGSVASSSHSTSAAGALLPLIALVARLGAGTAFDRGRIRVALGVALAFIAFAALVPISGAPALATVALATIGWASVTVLSHSIVVRHAAPGSRGLLLGALATAAVGGGGIGIWLFGAVRRTVGSYHPAELLTAVIASALLLLLARSNRIALLNRPPAL